MDAFAALENEIRQKGALQYCGNLKITPVLVLYCISTFTNVYIHRNDIISAGVFCTPAKIQTETDRYWFLYCVDEQRKFSIGVTGEQNLSSQKYTKAYCMHLQKYRFQYTQ